MEDFSSSNESDKNPAEEIQLTADLRASLWNLIYPLFNKNINHPIAGYDNSKWSDSIIKTVHACWKDFFKLTIDTIPGDATDCLGSIKEKFFKLMPDKGYDFLEFLGNNIDSYNGGLFRKNCNNAFERENSSYRFVGGKIVKITSRLESQSIENARNTPYTEVNNHISAAVRLLSDKNNPDYRNSIKESISAIEALVRAIVHDDKKTLAELLKQKKLNLHQAFQDGLNKIYGYTSDESGIRHSLTDGGREMNHADALFMAVLCSAFVNYIQKKKLE